MGRIFVIVIAALASVWGIWFFFPGVASVAFHVHGVSIAWTTVLFFPIGYLYHRMTA